MQVRCTKRALPRRWDNLPGASKAILIAEIRVTPHSKLWMKVLVFRNARALHSFWKRGLGRGDLGADCVGAVGQLGGERECVATGRKSMWVDPRYFAVMGLVVTHLNAEIITHECCHAGYAYWKRVKLRNMWPNQKEHDEEGVCYPSGLIAGRLNGLLWDHKIYDLYNAGVAREKRRAAQGEENAHCARGKKKP
jgi:hypothetical protein